MPSNRKKIGIVLFNLGGPDGPDAVEPFLFNLFNDKAIIGAPQPFRWCIAKLISRRRAPVARDIYAELGGGSPLVANTWRQADALAERVASELPDTEVKCFLAMRYWHPTAMEAAREISDWGADEIVLLPLYPQYSTTTTGSSLADWHRAAAEVGLSAPMRGICCYPAGTGFVQAIAGKLAESLSEPGLGPSPRILFTAHGLPQKIVDRGDPYQWAVEQTTAAVIGALDRPELDWRISYQSRVGPLEWIRPYTEDEIEAAGAERKPLVVVPIAFVSEHSETLVELDIEYRELAAKAGVPAYVRVPTVMDDPVFIGGLADLVIGALAIAPGLRGPEGPRICPMSCGQCPVGA